MYNMTKYRGDIPYCVPPTKLLGGHVPLVPRGFGAYAYGDSVRGIIYYLHTWVRHNRHA